MSRCRRQRIVSLLSCIHRLSYAQSITDGVMDAPEPGVGPIVGQPTFRPHLWNNMSTRRNGTTCRDGILGALVSIIKFTRKTFASNDTSTVATRGSRGPTMFGTIHPFSFPSTRGMPSTLAPELVRSNGTSRTMSELYQDQRMASR